MPPNPRVANAGANAAGVRRVAASGASPGRGAKPRTVAAKKEPDDGGDDMDMLSSIAGLIETNASVDSGIKPSPASGTSLTATATATGTVSRLLVHEMERFETDYSFLSPSFAAPSTTPSVATSSTTTASTNNNTPSDDPMLRQMSEEALASVGSFSHVGPVVPEPAIHANIDRLRNMSHDELLRYSSRLTSIVAAFMSQERQRRDAAAMGRNGDSVSSGAPTPQHAETPDDLLTASIRSFARQPVKHTNALEKGTDFEGNKTINEYSIIAELGRGAYGKVKLAVNNNTNETCAIKIMKKSVLRQGSGDRSSVVEREIAVMKKLRHLNVVPLYEVLDDPSGGKIYMVMKYIDSGPIVHLKPNLTCNKLPLPTAARYFRQLVSGLTYLHRHGVIHRDLKPDNIMLDSTGTVYLTDFGVSDIVSTHSNNISGTEGTPIFLSPELLSGLGGVEGPPVDVWALGITMYFAVFGSAPFRGETWATISHAIMNKPAQFPDDAPPEWRDVFERTFEKHPKQRITLRQLKKHAIFAEINFEMSRAELDDDSASMSMIHVSDAEIRGSMRRIEGPLKVDTAAFDNLSDRVKGRVSSFASRLRDTSARRKLEDIGGTVVDEVEPTSKPGTPATPETEPAAADDQPAKGDVATPPTPNEDDAAERSRSPPKLRKTGSGSKISRTGSETKKKASGAEQRAGGAAPSGGVSSSKRSTSSSAAAGKADLHPPAASSARTTTTGPSSSKAANAASGTAASARGPASKAKRGELDPAAAAGGGGSGGASAKAKTPREKGSAMSSGGGVDASSMLSTSGSVTSEKPKRVPAPPSHSSGGAHHVRGSVGSSDSKATAAKKASKQAAPPQHGSKRAPVPAAAAAAVFDDDDADAEAVLLGDLRSTSGGSVPKLPAIGRR